MTLQDIIALLKRWIDSQAVISLTTGYLRATCHELLGLMLDCRALEGVNLRLRSLHGTSMMDLELITSDVMDSMDKLIFWCYLSCFYLSIIKKRGLTFFVPWLCEFEEVGIFS